MSARGLLWPPRFSSIGLPSKTVMRRVLLVVAVLYIGGIVAWAIERAPRKRNKPVSAVIPDGSDSPGGSDASQPLPSTQPLLPTVLSFSLEQDRWPDWVGTDARNDFTYTALTNLQALTGTPPRIRVGANTEDRTTWSADVPVVQASFPPPNAITPYPEATSVTVGDKYYRLSSHLPPGTHMTWGINFAADDPTVSVAIAQSIMRAFSSSDLRDADVHLDLLEVGNEPDLFRGKSRPAQWSVQDYVADWIQITGAVVDGVQLTNHSRVRLLGASFAGQTFTASQIIDNGILDSEPGSLISRISQHRYSAAFCSGGAVALASFMSKAAIRSNLTVFNADIAKVKSKGLAYILGETGSVACHGAPGVSNTAGVALWVIDYTLQAVTLGISELYFHEGVGFKYNFIQPVPLNRSITDGSAVSPPTPPHVMPSYYGAVFVARAVGDSGSAHIAEIPIAEDNVSGYAIYEGRRLARAVFVNLNAWLQSAQGGGGSRPSVHVDLRMKNHTAAAAAAKNGTATATVRRLQIGHADDTSGLTLAGVSYETPDARPSGAEALETIRVADGFNLLATEAALISFQ